MKKFFTIVMLALIIVSISCTALQGDINNDGKVSIIDYTLLRLDMLNLKALGADDAQRTDVNNDGQVDTADLGVIKAMILGGGKNI